jgi:hypothetical protein
MKPVVSRMLQPSDFSLAAALLVIFRFIPATLSLLVSSDAVLV